MLIRSVPFHGTVCYVVQGASNFESEDESKEAPNYRSGFVAKGFLGWYFVICCYAAVCDC